MGENTLLINSLSKNVEFNKSLAPFFGYKTGGNALMYLEASSVKEVCSAIDYCNSINLPYKIIGNGTNILLSDRGYNGLVISLKKLSLIEYYRGGEIKVNAGASLSKLINFCIENGYSGIEGLSGIPATVGGATAMNAGAFLTCISDFITVVETVRNGKVFRYDRNFCKFGYRKSRFLDNKDVITSVRFKFLRDNPCLIRERSNEYLRKRKIIQPQGRTCGSVFKNPKGFYAGELIERASLKGEKIGGAEVSKMHANFIVAKENCTSQDVKKLINLVKFEVASKFGVKLNEEIEYLGEF